MNIFLSTGALIPFVFPFAYGAFCSRPRPSSFANTVALRMVDIPNPQTSGFIVFGDPSALEPPKQQQEQRRTNKLDMPWSEFQEWALSDNLPRYLVTISTTDDNTDDSSLPKSSTTFALWHTMLRDVPELSGYDVPCVRQMHQRMVSQRNDDDDDAADAQQQQPVVETPGAMPILEQFQFDAEGGISGNVYGLNGVADGSAVRTPPLSNLDTTVPKGYVRTEKGDVVYELGLPMGENDDGVTNWSKEGRMALLKTLSMTTTVVAGSAVSVGEGGGVDDGQLLLKLGGFTGALLAGATAMNMFQHHLTVNVFWV